jgi:hypothetical protein
MDSDGNLTYTVDTSIIYKILSVSNEFYGNRLNKYVSRDSAMIIPENETNEKDFAEFIILQSDLDGETIHRYAVNINDYSKNI